MTVAEQAENWPTPGANDYKGTSPTGQRRGQLDEAAEQFWRPPTASEDAAGTVNGNMQQMLTHQAKRVASSLPAPETETDGSESSPSAPTSRRQLNPRFAEWLMGWEPGWTSLAPLDSASLATG